MEYLKYFENKTSAEGYKTESWFVGYLGEEDLVLYSGGGEVIKDGEMVMDEPDPTEGFVDLGLSVMWASCNLGASNPEELGEKYNWGETNEHKSGEKEYEEYPNLNEHSYSYVHDAVTVSMKDNPYTKYLHYRTPTTELWQELIDNTTREVYTNSDGRNICKYISKINGNFILIPLLMEVNGNDQIYYKTSTPSENSYYGSIIRIWNDTGGTYIISEDLQVRSHQNNYVRGICSYPPKTDIIQYGNNISSDSTFALTSAHSIEITCPEDFTVYFSTTPDFTPDSSDENVVGYYTVQKHGDNCDIQISCKDLEFGQSNHTYLYARFYCDTPTTISVDLWNTTSVVSQSILITSGKTMTILGRSSDTLYRLKYEDWKGNDFKIKWTGNSTIPVYIASVCNFTLSSAADNVLIYKNISRKGTATVKAADIDACETSVDEQGFLYVRFNPTNKGNITFTSSEPADT